jgi:hypothetical protein
MIGHPTPSIEREFERVIMVEVWIGEMFKSDRSRPNDYKRAVVVEQRTMKRIRALLGVNGAVRSEFD